VAHTNSFERLVRPLSRHLHDGRLLTLEDTVEFFNPIVGAKLTGDEKQSCGRLGARASKA
jgi:hypothetical protein